MSSHQLVRLEYHEVTASDGFAAWLHENDVSVAFTNGARVFMVGARDDGSLSVRERQFGTSTAIAVASPDTIYLATRYQIWRLQNALPAGTTTDDGSDALYVPQHAVTTGLLGVHDLAVTGDDGIVFVNGLFSCLATVSDSLNFRPIWVPPWISALAPEDRCRLTGVVLEGDTPRFVTTASNADTKDGWRAAYDESGFAFDLASGTVVADGLSLPYSPALDGDGQLWLCNGARGELGVVRDGAYRAVAALPGFTRGLALLGRWAVVGTSRAPWAQDDEPAIGARLAQAGTRSRCGIHVVDTSTGGVEHSLEVQGVALEIADVALLPGVRTPSLVAFTGDEVENFVTIPDA